MRRDEFDAPVNYVGDDGFPFRLNEKFFFFLPISFFSRVHIMSEVRVGRNSSITNCTYIVQTHNTFHPIKSMHFADWHSRENRPSFVSHIANRFHCHERGKKSEKKVQASRKLDMIRCKILLSLSFLLFFYHCHWKLKRISSCFACATSWSCN